MANESPATGGPLGDLIGSAEGGKGGYDAFNRGTAGSGSGLKISAMTIRDITAAQALPAGDPNRLFAVGKYQLIPLSLKDAIQKLSIDTSETFSPELQEKIFRNYLIATKRPQVKAYITGESDDLAAAQIALAMEFASVARPDTGNSQFGGPGTKALVSAKQTAQALEQERERYRELVAKVWASLSTTG
jgi:hypothetical protein